MVLVFIVIWFPAGDDSEQNHHDGDDQQGMNEAAHNGAGNQPQQPQNNEIAAILF